MAIKKCKECGNDVSTKADKCPHCGAKVKNDIGCLGVIVIIIAIGIIINIVSKPDNTKSSSKSNVPAKIQSPKEIKEQKIEMSFSAWDGSHYGLKRLIKKIMNDPKSFEHVNTVYEEKKDHLIVKTTFRGKNAFGGVVTNWVTAKVDFDGNVLEIIEQGP